MDRESHKNKRGIRIRRISGNRSEDSLLDSEFDEDHPVVFTRRRINVIDSDDEFSTESLSDEENSEVMDSLQKIRSILDKLVQNFNRTSMASFVLTSK